MKNIEQLDQTIKEVLHYHLGAPSEAVVPDAVLENIGADSLDCLEITMDLEDKFDILISDEEANKIKTVGDLYNLMRTKISPPLIPEPEPAEETPKDESQVNN